MTASSNPVTLDEINGVGLLCINNPPVNALSQEVRAGIVDRMAQAARNTHLKVVLLASSGDLFSAGADLREFDSGLGEPSLQRVQSALEDAPIPVVAAIQGLALGGGLELAMACHYRIGHENARLGLPEINLGIIPGAGGTQRLPRLIGAKPALDMILSGSPISAADARASGLLDEVADGDLREEALKFCQTLLQSASNPRPTRNLTIARGLDESDISKTLATHARALKGRTTQHLVVKAIQAASLPFSEGISVEAALAQQSLTSRESMALRHIFFADRESGKVPGLPKDGAKKEIAKVAIVGAGTMGSGIAMAFADAGKNVTLIDSAEAALSRSREIIQSTYASSIKRGRLTHEIADQRIARIKSSTALSDAADAHLAIEAVFEDMELKKHVLFSLDSILPNDRPIASNTSTLSVTELGRATANPARILGMHFFVPAHASRLLEIVRGNDTAPETLAAALRVAKSVKKTPVVSADAFGFIGNRTMLDGYFREAEQLLLEGASPAEVDTALEQFGFAMGPQRVSDLGGNDVGTKVRIQLYKRAKRPDPYFVVADRLTELGRLGQKTSRGFYRYEHGSREALPDPDVVRVIETLAAERGIPRRKIGADEIVERCLLALINVGAMVLDEGVAARASDIDVVWTSGYGFPRHLGGPMFYADTLGLRNVADRIRYYHKKFGYYWQPAKLIETLAEANSSFEKWDREKTAVQV